MTAPGLGPLLDGEAPPAVLIVTTALQQWDQLVELVGMDRIGPRKPERVTTPWVRVRDAGGYPLDAARGAWSRTVQVEVAATAPFRRQLPELFTDRVATAIAARFDQARAGLFADASWRARLLDGPTELTDTTRGADVPVYKHGVRLDVRLHAHV